MTESEDRDEQATAHAERLKQIVETNNINQQDLADRIDTSRVAVNQVLNGKRGLTPLMALKLEAALGVEARSILESQLVDDLDKTYDEHKVVLERIRANPMLTSGESAQ